MTKIFNFVSILLPSLVLTTTASAAPITGGSVFALRDNEGASPVFTGQGENFSFGVANVTPDVYLGTIASAINNNNGITINPLTNYAFQNRPGLFAYETTYADAQNNGYLTPWTITVQNGTDTATGTTPDRSTAGKMEFVDNLSMTGKALAPTITWQLPTTGPNVDQVRYELWNNDTDQILSGESSVPLGATATSIDLSGLQIGTNYAVRIIVEERDAFGTVTRSSNWLGWAAKEGAAECTVLSLTTGSPAGALQTVVTPNEAFNVEFDYKFTTDTGSLEVFLADVLIGTQLEAAAIDGDEFLHAVFEVEDESLLGLSVVSLLFQLDGPTGSNVLIDNIMFPGLLNGDFEEGLNLWSPQGEGSVSTSAVPVPAAVWLLGSGLSGNVWYQT